MKTIVRNCLIGAVLSVVVFVMISIGASEMKRRNHANAFEKINAGASKQDVVSLLGEPKEIESCRDGEGCKDVFIYYSFMERRGFVFDGHGKVIDKYYNVSH